MSRLSRSLRFPRGLAQAPILITAPKSALVFRPRLWLFLGGEQRRCAHKLRFAEIRSDQLETGRGKASSLERDWDRKGGITRVVHRHGILQTKQARFK